MVSLLISKLGNLISGHRPQAVYELLKREGYLSEAAVAGPDAVVLAMQRVQNSWLAPRDLGAEVWRDMQVVLEQEGFLNADGLAAARQYVSRD